MSQKILYIGFGELINSVKSRLSTNPDVLFSEVMQLSSDAHENTLAGGDVFLVGPYTLEPVRQVQRASNQNPLISIIVLIFPDHFQKVKQSIQFAYNVGKNVIFVSYEFGKDITAVVDNALIRSKQRNSFASIAEQKTYPKVESSELTYQNLYAFLQNAPICAIVFDHQRRIITANNKAKQLFFPKIINPSITTWTELFSNEQATLSLLTENEQKLVHEVIRVNNQYLEIDISPLEVKHQQAHYLLLINDVTDKISAENQLQSKIAELEFLNQELDQFVNVVSHDFKTPLTSISLLAQLGIKATDHQKQTELFKQIYQSSNKLKELLKGLNLLVDVTKSRSEKVEPVDLQQGSI